MQTIGLKILNNSYNVLLNDFYCTGLLEDDRRFGELLINFYEIDLNLFADKINHKIDISVNYNKSIAQYIEKCYMELSAIFDPILVSLMLNEIENYLLSIDSFPNETINNGINEIFISYAILKMYIEKFIDGKLSDLNEFVTSIQSMTAKYYLSNDGKLCFSLLLDDIYSLIALEMLNIQNYGVPLKRCENCGKLFIPQIRSDEIYCDRIFKDSKTCKEVGYIEKEKRDPFKKIYTTARKTQHARIRYNNHIPDYKEKHYKPWKEAAEKARDEFKAKNDINGFKNWIKENNNKF